MPKKPDPKIPELYFEAAVSRYWMLLESLSKYLPLSGADVKNKLKRRGIHADMKNDYALSYGDQILSDIQDTRAVDYAGPLAGHKPGLFTTSAGLNILVTQGVTPPTPNAKTKWTRLENYLGTLFSNDQLEHVFNWMKCAYESLVRGDMKPGQMLAIVGDKGSCKGFFHLLVTELLGGRFAKPYRYMTDATTFNADIAQAEHQVIEDENSSSDIRSRRKFGVSIKDFTVNETMSVHGKGRQAITLPTFKRLTLSVNQEPENLMIFPPLDTSLLDKIHLFKVHKAQRCLSEDRLENQKMLKRELPGLVHYLLSEDIAKKFRCPRFGACNGHTDTTGEHVCSGYHHPEIVQVLNSMSPEFALLEMIDVCVETKTEPWGGSIAELKTLLLLKWPRPAEVEKLLYYNSSCGVYLSRLAAKFPARFESGRGDNNTTRWIIREPK